MPKNSHGCIEDYRLEDRDASDDLLSDRGFLEAFGSACTLLGICLSQRPTEKEASRARSAIRSVDVARDWPLGGSDVLALAADLIARGVEEDERTLDLEFQRLFRGTGMRAAEPFGSVHTDRDQVMYGWTWMELRAWMRMHGIECASRENEPEDQIGLMLLLCAALASRDSALIPEFLGRHLMPWAPRFFELFLGDMRTSTFKGLGVLAQATLDDACALLGIVPARFRLYR